MSRSLDAADVIASLATHENVVVTRRGPGTFVNSIAVAGSTSTFTIPFAVVWPASGRDLDRLPEGRRTVETWNFGCADQIIVGAQAGNNADLVTLDGAQWEAQTAASWFAATGFYVSLIQRPAT